MSGVLNNKMKEIVKKEVSHYKSDLEIDFDIIKETIKDCPNGKAFIWYTRESGTAIMREDFIKVIGSEENVSFNYWAKSVISCYKIVVTKACTNNIYGSIEKINFNKYYKEMKLKEKNFERFIGRIITRKDKTMIEKEFEFSKTYYRDALKKEKLDSTNVLSFKILKYIA